MAKQPDIFTVFLNKFQIYIYIHVHMHIYVFFIPLKYLLPIVAAPSFLKQMLANFSSAEQKQVFTVGRL